MNFYDNHSMDYYNHCLVYDNALVDTTIKFHMLSLMNFYDNHSMDYYNHCLVYDNALVDTTIKFHMLSLMNFYDNHSMDYYNHCLVYDNALVDYYNPIPWTLSDEFLRQSLYGLLQSQRSLLQSLITKDNSLYLH
ncbi:hypothetical protein MKX96_05715 [Psychrobacillus sp. FSL W7-1493]|uniref:hypothetical protein n=1 Tax=Psychrobacillus sp. FSL W7-1493 TaxID=2921552 RepID=UPI0030F727DF